jgi:hypothetical protein
MLQDLSIRHADPTRLNLGQHNLQAHSDEQIGRIAYSIDESCERRCKGMRPFRRASMNGRRRQECRIDGC